MELPDSCEDKSGRIVKLKTLVYCLKQTARRWAMRLGHVLVRKIGIESCKADRCLCFPADQRYCSSYLYVYVDDINVAGEPDAGDFLSTCFLEEFQTLGGELSWYLERAFERDRERVVHRMLQRAFKESVGSRYGVDAVSELPASS